jgi:hypothetical protein
MLPQVKLASTTGQCIGVVVGCLLGMTSLLFMDLERKERLKKQAELSTLFDTLLCEGTPANNAYNANRHSYTTHSYAQATHKRNKQNSSTFVLSFRWFLMLSHFFRHRQSSCKRGAMHPLLRGPRA